MPVVEKAREQPSRPRIAPLSFALGIVVLLVELIISPLVVVRDDVVAVLFSNHHRFHNWACALPPCAPREPTTNLEGVLQ